MQRKDIENFINKNVKLVQKDNWVLYGQIINISEDCLTFRSKQSDSIISFDYISLIVEKNGDYYDR